MTPVASDDLGGETEAKLADTGDFLMGSSSSISLMGGDRRGVVKTPQSGTIGVIVQLSYTAQKIKILVEISQLKGM